MRHASLYLISWKREGKNSGKERFGKVDDECQNDYATGAFTLSSFGVLARWRESFGGSGCSGDPISSSTANGRKGLSALELFALIFKQVVCHSCRWRVVGFSRNAGDYNLEGVFRIPDALGPLRVQGLDRVLSWKPADRENTLTVPVPANCLVDIAWPQHFART
jgi:hypothetical protein